MGSRARPPESVLAYARDLAGRLGAGSGGSLRAAYLHGSAVLGGWVPGCSDVDMLFVAADGDSSAAVARMGRALRAGGGECPGRELECSVVTVTHARQPAPPWPFVLHVVAGPGKTGRTVRPEGQSAGDADLLMHYAVCRAAGWPVYGPRPRELIGTVPRRAILGYLAGELSWGLEHAPEAYAVLNACRALIYLTDQEIVSKIAGGEAALERGAGPAGVVRRALDQQQGREPERPAAQDAVRFVLDAAGALRSAAREGAAGSGPAEAGTAADKLPG